MALLADELSDGLQVCVCVCVQRFSAFLSCTWTREALPDQSRQGLEWV